MPRTKKIIPKQSALTFTPQFCSEEWIKSTGPYYTTNYGATYLGNSLELLSELPDNSIDLVFTSPPYALHYKKNMGMLKSRTI